MAKTVLPSGSDDLTSGGDGPADAAARQSRKGKATRAKLTDALVRNARPGPTLRIIHDTSCTGFALRIYPTGRKTWGFAYRVGERRGNVVLGRYVELASHRAAKQDGKNPLTLSEARALARSYRAKVEAGIDPFAPVAVPLIFRDLALMWLECQRHLESDPGHFVAGNMNLTHPPLLPLLPRAGATALRPCPPLSPFSAAPRSVAP